MIEETAGLATGQHLSLHFSSLSRPSSPLSSHTGDNRLTAIFF